MTLNCLICKFVWFIKMTKALGFKTKELILIDEAWLSNLVYNSDRYDFGRAALNANQASKIILKHTLAGNKRVLDYVFKVVPLNTILGCIIWYDVDKMKKFKQIIVDSWKKEIN